METPEINSENPIEANIKRQNKRFVLWIVFLIIGNTLMFTILIKSDRPMIDNFLAALFGNLAGYNIFGFLVGTMAALFPYKNLPYGKKYLRASLLSILVIHSVMTCGLLCILMMTLAGWY